MSEVLDEFEEGSKSSFDKLFYGKLLLLVLLVIAFGIYVGDVLFGKSSLEVLLDLQDKKSELIKNVQEIKEQNAILQKEYFELKQLEPQE